jgi:hypothetical protein
MHVSSWTAAPVQRCRGSCGQSDRHPQCTQGLRGVPTGQNPEDSNVAWRPCSGSSSPYPSAMTGVTESILHSTEHHHARATFVLWLPVVQLPVAVADHVSRCGKTCGPTKQPPKYPSSHINAELLLRSTHYASSYDSHRLNVETDIFSSCAPFGYTLYTLMEELWGNGRRLGPPKQLLSWRRFPRRYCFLSLDLTERPCDSMVAQLKPGRVWVCSSHRICLLSSMLIRLLSHFLVYFLLRLLLSRLSRCSGWLRAGRPRGRSSSPGSGKIFLLCTASRPVLGPIQPPIHWVSGAISPGVMRPRREADRLHPTSAEVMKTWTSISTPPYAFMV